MAKMSWQDMCRDTTGQANTRTRKGKKAKCQKETVPGFSWVPVDGGRVKVAPYIRHEPAVFVKDANGEATRTEDANHTRPYVRMSDETDLPEVIGLTIRKGETWDAAAQLRDIYIPVEAFELVLDADVLKAFGKASSAIFTAVKKAAATK